MDQTVLSHLALVGLACIMSCPPSAAVLPDARVVEVCQGRPFRLTCAQGSVIQLQSIRLVDSRCLGSSNCCPRPNDCSASPTSGHRRLAHVSCDGQRSCSLATERRKIPCGHFGFPVNNDYERIIYLCIELPTVTSKSTPTTSTASTTTTTPAITTTTAAAAADDDDDGGAVRMTSDARVTTSVTPHHLTTVAMDAQVATSTNDQLLQPRAVAESSQSHVGSFSLTIVELVAVIGVVTTIMFVALVSINVCLCRRLMHHYQHHQQQQQQDGMRMSVEMMNNHCTASSSSHHCTTGADAVADDGVEWRCSATNHYETADDCRRSSPVNFYKPLTTTTDHVSDIDQLYEDIDIYLTPITERH